MFGLMLFYDVISFGASISEALARLEEVLCRLSDFGLQLKAKKCTFMQTEVAFLGHIVGRRKYRRSVTGNAPSSVKGVRQFVGFIGYYRRFVRDFAGLSEPLVTLTWKGVPFVWTDRQAAFEAPENMPDKCSYIGLPHRGRTVNFGYRCQLACDRRGS